MSVPSKSLEKLRHDAQSFAQQLPQASSRDEALEIAIKAAETSMQALKLANDPKEKAQLSNGVKRLLTDAENIKRTKDWRATIQQLQPEVGAGDGTTGTTSKVRVLKEPQSHRKLHTSEQVLLLKAGYLNGFKFPPWTTPPEPSEFELREGEELFLYVSLILLGFRHVPLTVSQPETCQNSHFQSFKKKYSTVGNVHQRRCHLHYGSRKSELTLGP